MIYFISDIHANLFALKAVLTEIPKNSTILCSGDVVGYYTEPNEVCELLQERQVICIKGNHDKYVLGQLSYNKEHEYKYRVERTRSLLSSENLIWLESLPEKRLVSFVENNQKIWVNINHGGFNDCEEYLYPNTEIFLEEPKEFTIYVFGHTHHPMIKKYKNHMILNPGSVGQPRDWDPRVSYASYNFLNKELSIHRLEYDMKRYQSVLYDNNISEDMIKILSRRRGES